MIAQKKEGMSETKARWQNEAAQKTAEYHDHLKRSESHLNQVPSNQAIQTQRSQRDLEIHAEEFQATNKILEEQLAAQKESEEELRIAKERFSSRTIDIPDGDDDIGLTCRNIGRRSGLTNTQTKAENLDAAVGLPTRRPNGRFA